MPKPLDATMRELYEVEPAAWLEFLGIPVPDPALVAVIDFNLSTVTADSDKLIRRGGPDPMILHTEFLSGRVVSYPRQLHRYNALASYKHAVPVWSVLFLLRRAADGPELTGEYIQQVPGRGVNLRFRYDVVRVWQVPPERLLNAGLPLVPLAPVSDVPRERLSEVLAAVARRLRNEAAPELKGAMWAATEILLGLNHPKELVKELTEEITTMVLGIRGIEESSVYRDIFAKGEAKGRTEGEAKGRTEGEAKGRAEERGRGRTEGEAKGRVAEGQGDPGLRQGCRKRLGPPDEAVLERIAGMSESLIASTSCSIASSTHRAGMSCWPPRSPDRGGGRGRRRSSRPELPDGLPIRRGSPDGGGSWPRRESWARIRRRLCPGTPTAAPAGRRFVLVRPRPARPPWRHTGPGPIRPTGRLPSPAGQSTTDQPSRLRTGRCPRRANPRSRSRSSDPAREPIVARSAVGPIPTGPVPAAAATADPTSAALGPWRRRPAGPSGGTDDSRRGRPGNRAASRWHPRPRPGIRRPVGPARLAADGRQGDVRRVAAQGGQGSGERWDLGARETVRDGPDRLLGRISDNCRY